MSNDQDLLMAFSLQQFCGTNSHFLDFFSLGSVERANQTFKRRLQALQRERGFPASHSVELLLELAIIINTTTRTLPGKKTPFEVWFGRKPRWTRPDYLATEPVGVNDDLLHVDNEEFSDDPQDCDSII